MSKEAAGANNALRKIYPAGLFSIMAKERQQRLDGRNFNQFRNCYVSSGLDLVIC